MPYYIDYYYFVLIVPVLFISLICQARVNSAYSKFSRLNNMNGLTGADAARRVLDFYGIQNVRIEHIRGKLNDHYDPRDNVIRLSDGVYGSCSVAAIGIACHEAGHAAQHAENYTPIKVRNALLMPCQIGSRAAIPLAVIGIFLGSQLLVNIGIFFYVFVMLFQLVTLPVEFNASNRALAILKSGYFGNKEYLGAKKVLNAAAMTYVASALMSLLELFRLILSLTGMRSDD